MRTRAQWIELAKYRVVRILGKYRCCPLRMIEAKVAEAGPGDKRPNPVAISEALRLLVGEGRVQELERVGERESVFYGLGGVDWGRQAFKELRLTRRGLYVTHRALAGQNELCGYILEKIIDSALEQVGGVTFVSRFPAQNVPKDRPLDFVVEIGGVKWGGEAKNHREWLYPESWEIWSPISKCCEIDAVPMVVARKFPYVTYLLFKHGGIVGYQTHFQYFHPVVSHELARVKPVDGLGYKDIRCVVEADKNLVGFFQRTLPRVSKDFRTRFDGKKHLLKHFADEKGLANRKLPPDKRRAVFSDAWHAIVGGEVPDDLLV